MSSKKPLTNCIKIKINRGEKSRPPAAGIYLLKGDNIFNDISSTISMNGFEFFGCTQLRITPPIIANNITLIII